MKTFSLNPNYGISYLKPLFCLANILAIAPPYSFGNLKVIPMRLFQVYSGFLLGAIFGSYLYSTYGMAIKRANLELTLREFVLEILYYAGLQLVCLLPILRSSFYKRKSWMKMLESFEAIDRNRDVAEIRSKYLIFFKEVFGEIVMIIILASNVYLWVSTHGWEYYKYFFIEVVEYTYMYAVTVLMVHILINLRYRYVYVNEILEEMNWKRYFLKKYKIELSGKALPCCIKYNYSRRYHFNIPYVIGCFGILNTAVVMFNEIFGSVIFSMLCCACTGALDALNYFLDYRMERTYPMTLYLSLLLTNMVHLVSNNMYIRNISKMSKYQSNLI